MNEFAVEVHGPVTEGADCSIKVPAQLSTRVWLTIFAVSVGRSNPVPGYNWVVGMTCRLMKAGPAQLC